MIKKQYPGIITAGREGETPYYTNSSHLPVGYTSDVFEALDIQDELQTFIYIRNCIPCIPWRKTSGLESGSNAGTKDRTELQTAVLYDFSNLFDPQRTWLYCRGNILPVLTVEKKQRFTAGSPVIIVRFRTGTMERRRNTKERKLYEISPSKLSEVKTNIVTISKDEVKVEPTDNIRYLFTTKTCPNCAAAKEILGEENYVPTTQRKIRNWLKKYGVMQAPTLVVVENNRAKKIRQCVKYQKVCRNKIISICRKRLK